MEVEDERSNGRREKEKKRELEDDMMGEERSGDASANEVRGEVGNAEGDEMEAGGIERQRHGD